MQERILETVLLIPLVRNSDRRPHRPLCWDELHRAFASFAGGFTRLVDCDTVDGEWEGVLDRSRRYAIAIPESRVDTLCDMIRGFLDVFDQEVFYFTVLGEVRMITKDAE